MAWSQNAQTAFTIPSQSYAPSGTRANVSLNTAYTHLTSGTASAIRFVASVSGNLTDCYMFNDLTTGTRANVTLRGRLYDAIGAGSNSRPGTGLLGTATNATLPASDDQWVSWNFSSPVAVTAGTTYWFVVDNIAGAPATDFCGLMSAANMICNGSINNPNSIGYVSSTTGFTTNGTVNSRGPVIVVISGQAFGSLFTIQSNGIFANNTRRRGLRFHNDLKYFRIVGVALTVGTITTPTTIEFCDASAAPGSSILESRALNPTLISNVQTHYFDTPVTLTGSTDFHVVLSGLTTNSVAPGGPLIEDYASISSVVDSMFDGMSFCYGVQDDGVGGWTLFRNIAVGMSLIIEGLNIPSASGGLLSQGFII